MFKGVEEEHEADGDEAKQSECIHAGIIAPANSNQLTVDFERLSASQGGSQPVAASGGLLGMAANSAIVSSEQSSVGGQGRRRTG